VLTRLRRLTKALMNSQGQVGPSGSAEVAVTLAADLLPAGPDGEGVQRDLPLSHAVELFDEAMYQATAVLVFRTSAWDPLSHTTARMDGELIDAVVTCPVQVWKTTAMQTALACWSWLVSERPETETRLMHAMQLAWSWSIAERKGIFSTCHGREQGPEAVFTQHVGLRPPCVRLPRFLAALRAVMCMRMCVGQVDAAPRLSRAPVLWLSFLEFRFRVVRRRSRSQAQAIANMVLHALDQGATLNRHFSAITAKCGGAGGNSGGEGLACAAPVTLCVARGLQVQPVLPRPGAPAQRYRAEQYTAGTAPLLQAGGGGQGIGEQGARAKRTGGRLIFLRLSRLLGQSVLRQKLFRAVMLHFSHAPRIPERPDLTEVGFETVKCRDRRSQTAQEKKRKLLPSPSCPSLVSCLCVYVCLSVVQS
jgi:hypothetical protein